MSATLRTALSPLPAAASGVWAPSAIVGPYWKKYAVACLFGSTRPASRALENVMLDAAPVVTVGLAASADAGAASPIMAALSTSAPNHLLRIDSVLPDIDVLTPTSIATPRIPR